MYRILKAFAWMRWRMLVNAIERTGSRDVLERFSMAVEKLGPIIAALLLIPSALVLLGFGVTGGYSIAAVGAQASMFAVVRYMLLGVPVLALVGPLFLPAADRTNAVRLLLLPIPRVTLYVAQASAGFGDVWNILMIPLVLGVPIGIAVAGAPISALATLMAAVLLILAIIGLAALATTIVHLIVRDRRRGELMALIFIIVIPVVSMMPGLLDGSKRTRGERQAPRAAWLSATASGVAMVYPTELFVKVAQNAVAGNPRGAVVSLAGIAVTVLLVHGIGFVLFRRVLASPSSSGARRAVATRRVWGRRLPGLSTAASAVALAHLRLALRTPRGRSILLSPIAMLLILGLLLYTRSDAIPFASTGEQWGVGLAAFASFVCLMSILPMAMNQFAVDKAGLTMTLLAPLSDREVLAGKAVGNGLIAAGPTLVSAGGAYALFPGGSPYVWLALVLGLVSIFALVAPVAAILSAVFPRAVDMNSIGRGSNAHGAAGMLGMLAFMFAGVPPVLITLLATRVLERPPYAPLLVLLWCGVSFVAARLLFAVARRIFASRRENLAMVV